VTPRLPADHAARAEYELRRDLRLFYAFRLLATSYLYFPIFMFFQAQRGLSYFEQLALGGIYSAVIVVAEVPTGVFADRFGRRRSMLAGALAMVGSCVIALGAHDFSTFVIAEALAAVSIALCSGADTAYLYDLLAAHDRVHEYPRRESAASAWHLVGSGLAFAGGGLLARVDLALPYVVTAAVAATAAVIACAMRDERPRVVVPGRGDLRSWGRQTVGALAEVGRNGRLVWIVAYSAVVFVLLRATVYVYQPYLEERGLDALDIGVLFAAVYLVSAGVAYRTHALRRQFGEDRLMWGILAVLVASFVGLAGAGAGAWMFALLLVQAIVNGIFSPLTKPLLNREIADSSRRAAVLSVESMVRRAAMGLFAPLLGLHGQADVMLLCGAVGLGGMLLLAVARVPLAQPGGSARKPD
jgi:MFS family permease